MTPLKAMLAEAYELELLRTDAARVRVIVGGGQTPDAPPKTATREQIYALSAALDPRDRLLVLLLRWTGLRIAEALGLRWHDLCDQGDGPVLLSVAYGRTGASSSTPRPTRASAPSPSSPSLQRALADARSARRSPRRRIRSSRPAMAPTRTATTCAGVCGPPRGRPACRG
jgi:hypothetical protein